MISDSAEVVCGGAAMVIAVALHLSKSSAALFNRCAMPQRIMVALQWLAVAVALRGYE
jgi:hypothetical protein